MEKNGPQKPAKVDIMLISIVYLVVVSYRHKHCTPQKDELDLACRDRTTKDKECMEKCFKKIHYLPRNRPLYRGRLQKNQNRV
jgi:hypothetical protein